MTHLTTEQSRFLRRHKIPLDMVFDGTGMSPSEYREAMKRTDKYFVFGVEPCASEGHTLRSRSGNCIQCDTANITFQLRHERPAYVYLAASRSRQLFKVGSSNEVDHRMGMLSKVSYGEASDWLCIAKVKCKRAGQIEFSIHEKLKNFCRKVPYIDSGREIEGQELFTSSYNTARIAFIQCIPEEERSGIWHHPAAKIVFNFADRPQVT